MEKQVVPRLTAEAMARAYQQAMQQIEDALTAIKKADGLLQTAFNDNYSFLPYLLTRHTMKDIQKETKRKCWYRIAKMLQLDNFLTTTKKNELYRQIDEDKTPEITTENIITFCTGITQNLPDFMDDMFEEVVKWLQPSKWNKHKTNKANKYEISKKVIKTWVFDSSFGLIRFMDHSKQMVNELDNVFHLLDGKGLARYPKNAVTAIEDAIKKKEWNTETTYFKFKWFKNGNLHITFKRLDLLRELNKKAGENKLRPKREGRE